jgi:beta-glucosidase
MPFKKDFVWGAATAAYQIEGASLEDGRKESIWDVFCKQPTAVRDGSSGAVACDHYHRYPEDVDIMKQIGLKAYRFSIAWPRIVPNGHDGVINEKGLAFYDRLIDLLLAKGIEPYVTLYHWDMPLGLQLRGGWLNPEFPRWFERYTEAVVDRFSDRVSNWITFNEPQCAISLGLELGTHAPGLKLPRVDVLLASHHMLLAHGRATATLRARAKITPSISFAPVGGIYYPAEETVENIQAARTATFEGWERGCWAPTWFCDPIFFGHYPEEALKLFGKDAPVFTDEEMRMIAQPPDVCSLNFYKGFPVRAAKTASGWEPVKHPEGHPCTAFGWPVTPEASYWLSRFYYERYQKPILITENGMSSIDWVDCDGEVKDYARIDFLRRYLKSLRRAADEGIPINGYFQWTLLDNFEWAEGYTQRFGMVHVDNQTQKRTLKQSAYWYRDIIASNGETL